MGLLRKAIFLVVAGFIGQYIFKIVIILGYFNHIYRHQPGPCRIVPGIENGSEDAQATSDGLLFVTSGLKHLSDPNHPNFKDQVGQIFLVDTTAENTQAVSLPIQGGLNRETFSPHGLSLWKDKQSGNQYVYVVNHPGDRDYVEKFLYDAKENVLKHLDSFTSEDFGVINDLVVVGLDQFYYTNWRYLKSHIGHLLEFFLGLHVGGVGYFDGNMFSMVVTGLSSPNGINVSPDQKMLYVALNGYKRVDMFKINKDSTVSEFKSIPLNTIPDNIDVHQETGDLFIGTVPIPYRAFPNMDNPRATNPPAQALRVRVANDGAADTEEVYADDGHLVFGSTVAVYISKRLYVGTLYHKMAECDVMYLS